MTREQRVITTCQVEFDKLGQRVQAVTEDLSRHGAFVRTDAFLPVGEIVELLLHMPRGRSVPLIARVAHIMNEQTARALGRTVGMGFELLEQDAERRRQLVAFLEEMVEEATPPPQELPRQVRVLVADGSSRKSAQACVNRSEGPRRRGPSGNSNKRRSHAAGRVGKLENISSKRASTVAKPLSMHHWTNGRSASSRPSSSQRLSTADRR